MIFKNFSELDTDRFVLKKLMDSYMGNLLNEMSDDETMRHSGMIIVNAEE